MFENTQGTSLPSPATLPPTHGSAKLPFILLTYSFFSDLHPVWFSSPSLFHILILFPLTISLFFLVAVRVELQTYLKLFVSVPIRRCSLNQKTHASKDRVTSG